MARRPVFHSEVIERRIGPHVPHVRHCLAIRIQLIELIGADLLGPQRAARGDRRENEREDEAWFNHLEISLTIER